MDTLRTSSIGYGQDQCGPGPSNASLPCATGLPSRRMIARSFERTVKKPDPRKTRTRIAIRTLTIAKLLRSASDNAWDPASNGVSGGGGVASGMLFISAQAGVRKLQIPNAKSPGAPRVEV